MKGTPVFPGGVGQLRVGRLAVAAAAFACVATVAGCSSSSSPPPHLPPRSRSPPPQPPLGSASNSTPASTPSPAVTGPRACPTSSLQVKQGVAQGYAGGVYQVIDFTNTSGSTCTLYGYPGVSLVSGPPYTQIGLAAKRTTDTPGQAGHAGPGRDRQRPAADRGRAELPERQLRPTKATALKIYPPNQTVPVYLPSASNGCGKSVQIMYIGPVQTGSGSSS